MAKLEKVIQDSIQVDFYLEDVSNEQFVKDVKELMAEYSDNGVIDRAIELLQSCSTKKPD